MHVGGRVKRRVGVSRHRGCVISGVLIKPRRLVEMRYRKEFALNVRSRLQNGVRLVCVGVGSGTQIGFSGGAGKGR